MKRGEKIITYVGLSLFVFMLAALVLLSQSLQNSQLFDKYYSILFVFNAIGLLLLVVLIAINFRRLLRQKKNKVIGSKMTTRMVVFFAFLSVTPVLVVYYFSLDFLHRGIDSWFDLRVEQALDDSLQLSRLALDIRMRELLKTTEQTSSELSSFNDAVLPFEIDRYREQMGAKELTLLNTRGAIIASSSSSTSGLVPDLPGDSIILQLQQGNNYIGLDVIKDSDLLIRIVTNVPSPGIDAQPRILQALFPISERINQLTESVQTSYIKYKELSYLRDQLKISFIIVLTLVLLFSIFSAVWAAFYYASNLSAPIKNLAEGTRAVADGNFSTRLPVPGNDELGYLVSSFNDMTDKIEQARNNAKHSQLEAEEQRSYLETVLSRLSSGVMVINEQRQLEKINESAALILQVGDDSLVEADITLLAEKYPKLAPFFECISNNIEEHIDDWREQITIQDKTGDQIIIISGATLTTRDALTAGHVIVFDEITALVKGQRDAAYSEMARRLTHEIKNPLTPIQLAAERLRHKYLPNMDAADADTLDRMTNTIIQQVETMKEMVNNFSDYARAPEFTPDNLDIVGLIEEVVDLFGNLDFSNCIKTDFADDLPLIHGDEKKLRQVFNNLIRNAVDANTIGNDKNLTISVDSINENSNQLVEIRIKDSGPGIEPAIAKNLFDPYVTSKQKGTGLGLSIVKKIIEEHQGQVWLENNENEPGACAVVRLPTHQMQTELKQYRQIS
ncbi:MAG: ATP-binding protein [Gammaproteobacteria bacterium]